MLFSRIRGAAPARRQRSHRYDGDAGADAGNRCPGTTPRAGVPALQRPGAGAGRVHQPPVDFAGEALHAHVALVLNRGTAHVVDAGARQTRLETIEAVRPNVEGVAPAAG